MSKTLISQSFLVAESSNHVVRSEQVEHQCSQGRIFRPQIFDSFSFLCMRWLCEASKKNRESFATIGFCSLTASWFMPEKVVYLQRGGSWCMISYLTHELVESDFSGVGRGWRGGAGAA